MKKYRFLTAVLFSALPLFTSLLEAADASPAGHLAKSGPEPRSRTLIDADWRFKIEPQTLVNNAA